MPSRRHLLWPLPWRGALRAVLWMLATLWSLLLLAWLTLYWGILPRIDEWRPEVERHAAAALGVPVAIGRIEVLSSGWVPVVTLRDVRLFERAAAPGTPPALQLPQVTAALSARGLWHLAWSWRLQFEQLLLEGPSVELRRDAQGRWWVAGLPLQGARGEDGGAAADWLFDQHEVVVRGGRLRWLDEAMPGVQPVALEAVDFVLRNRLRSHRARLDATPVGWGERFSLRAAFQQPLWSAPGDWRRWIGTVQAELPQADLATLGPYLPFRLIEGDGALRAWLDVARGVPTGVTVDVALHRLALQWPGAAQPLGLHTVQGRFSARRTDGGASIAGQDLSFSTDGGLRWPRSRFAVAWRQKAGEPAGGEASADRLDLPVLAEIAERLPLGEAVVQRLADWRLQGEAEAVQARWEGELDAPQRYDVRAKVGGLGLDSAPGRRPGDLGRPGLQGAQIALQATERGGSATLAVHDGSLTLPGVFEPARIEVEQFQAEVDWKLAPVRGADGTADGTGIELRWRRARLRNADLGGEFNGTWRNPLLASAGREAGGPGWLQLDGRLEQARGAAVARYLPLGVGTDARRYVAQAVLGGRVDGANVRLRGPLALFPFTNPRDGEFHIDGRVSDVTLAYVPPDAPGQPPQWPAFQRLAAELVFDRQSMEIREASARLWGLDIRNTRALIRRLDQHPVLEVDGQVRGPLADLLRYANATPVAGWSGHALKAASGSGTAELKLGLALPLEDIERGTVKGSVTLAGNELRLQPDLPALSQARGRVDFSDKGFSVAGATARALGGDLQIDGGSTPDGQLRFTAMGTVSADGLRRAAEVPLLQRLGALASGQTGYRLQFGLVRGLPEFTLTSTLAGLALDLPAPLGKRAETALPLRLQTVLAPDASATGAQRDTLRLELGSLAQAVFQRDLKAAQPVQRSALALQEPLPAPQPGGVAALSFGRLDLDAWSALAERLSSGGSGSAADAMAYWPRQTQLKAQTLVAGGRQLDQVAATLTPTGDGGWRVAGTAAQAAGTVEYRAPGGAGGSSGRITARLSRLALADSEAERAGQPAATEAPKTVPALDVVIDDFELHGKRLGRLEIDGLNRNAEPPAVGTEWLARFSLANPDGQLSGSAHWQPPTAGRRRTGLDFKLEIADAGGLLKRLGLEDAIKGGKGRLQGAVAWNGSPLAIDYPSLDGSLNLALENGQFLKAAPGAARLLGVLNLQALPRRLTLDFRDLFQQGFAFDKVDGDVKIARGVASTNNLRMRGVQAAVLMEGQTDLERETQDLRVIVVPEINAGTASLAYAAINPAIGIGTFVAQLFLRRPLMAAGTREFHVHGSWDEPKVDRVERRGAPAPDADNNSAAAEPASPPPSGTR